MRAILPALALIFCVTSCWDKVKTNTGNQTMRVWGSKPVYGVDSSAKKIQYLNVAQPVKVPGNIYTKDNYIYQLEVGKGIHVIDNSTPSQAKRIGFITINGSSQISIKGNFLYSNSFDDLVVLDISNLNNIMEVKRVRGAFPEGRVNYYYVRPVESGYYECPRYDSLVVDWRKDSIWSGCYKN